MDTEKKEKLEREAEEVADRIGNEISGIRVSAWRDSGAAESVWELAPLVINIYFDGGDGGEAEEVADGEKPRRERVEELIRRLNDSGLEVVNDVEDISGASVKLVGIICNVKA